MKVALIGVGKWGSILQGELSKVAEVKYACDSKADLNQVWNDAEVEAVFIATPTHTHFAIADKALDAGKHVFLEKPGTDSSADLEKLVTKAQEKNLTFAVGYEFPHHPAVQKLKELIAGKKMKSLHFEWQKWGTFNDSAIPHLLCHDISVMKSLGLTGIAPATCLKKKVITATDLLWSEFTNDQGVYAESLINRVSPIKQKMLTALLENEGYIVSNNDLFSINFQTQALDKIEVPPGTPVAAELSDFISAIAEKREPLSNGAFALEVYKVIEQAQSL